MQLRLTGSYQEACVPTSESGMLTTCCVNCPLNVNMKLLAICSICTQMF